MTIANVAAGALIDPAWGNTVANDVNRIPHVRAATSVVVTDASGYATVAFGVTFPAAPRVVACSGQVDAFRQVQVDQASTTTTTFRVRVLTDVAAPVVGNVRIEWIAVGAY